MAENANPFADVEPTEKGARSLERIKERLGIDALPPAFDIFAGAESGLNDIYMNINRQFAGEKLEEKTKFLVAVGVAAALGSAEGTKFFAKAAQEKGRTQKEILDAIAAASTCTIFNGYYRFRHQLPEAARGNFEKFRAPFNANSFMKTGLDTIEIEAICIAVSSVNNCEMCVEGHMAKGEKAGLTDEQIDEIIKAGAVASAAAATLGALSFQNAPETVAN